MKNILLIRILDFTKNHRLDTRESAGLDLKTNKFNKKSKFICLKFEGIFQSRLLLLIEVI